jgi:L-rhamnose mutarotase
MEGIEAACQCVCSKATAEILPTHNLDKNMIRKAFVMELTPGCEEEYEKRHNPIWQDLIDVFAQHGVHNYSIFLHEAGHQLFGYVEIEDEARWAAIAQTDACRRWWKHMQDVMRYNDDGTPWAVGLREVFHLD